MMPVPIAVFGLADLLMYLDAAGHPVPAGVGWRLALAAVISLISLIGARIIPTFTRNWLASRRDTSLRPTPVGLDRLANAVLHVGLLGWVLLRGTSAFSSVERRGGQACVQSGRSGRLREHNKNKQNI